MSGANYEPERMQEISRRLEEKGVIPKVVIAETKNLDLNRTGHIDKEELEKIVQNKVVATPLTRLAAQYALDNYDAIRDGGSDWERNFNFGLTPDMLERHSRVKQDLALQADAIHRDEDRETRSLSDRDEEANEYLDRDGKFRFKSGNREFTEDRRGDWEYSVKSGDTMWSIAKDVFQHANRRQGTNAEIVEYTRMLAEFNEMDREGRSADRISINQRIRVPGEF